MLTKLLTTLNASTVLSTVTGTIGGFGVDWVGVLLGWLGVWVAHGQVLWAEWRLLGIGWLGVLAVFGLEVLS